MARKAAKEMTYGERHRAALVERGGRAITVELNADEVAALDALRAKGYSIRDCVGKSLVRVAKDASRAR